LLQGDVAVSSLLLCAPAEKVLPAADGRSFPFGEGAKPFVQRYFGVFSTSCHRFAGCWVLGFDSIFLVFIEEKGAFSTPGAANEDVWQTQIKPAWFNCSFVSL